MDAKEKVPVTDLEWLDLYLERSWVFIDPFLFREIDRRGLVHFVNFLNVDTVEAAKRVVRQRLQEAGRLPAEPYDDEMARVSQVRQRLHVQLRKLRELEESNQLEKLVDVSTEVHMLCKRLDEYLKTGVI